MRYRRRFADDRQTRPVITYDEAVDIAIADLNNSGKWKSDIRSQIIGYLHNDGGQCGEEAIRVGFRRAFPWLCRQWGLTHGRLLNLDDERVLEFISNNPQIFGRSDYHDKWGGAAIDKFLSKLSQRLWKDLDLDVQELCGQIQEFMDIQYPPISEVTFWKLIETCRKDPSRLCKAVPTSKHQSFVKIFRAKAYSLDEQISKGQTDAFSDGIFAVVLQGKQTYDHLVSMVKSGNWEQAYDDVVAYGYDDAGDTKAYLTDLDEGTC